MSFDNTLNLENVVTSNATPRKKRGKIRQAYRDVVAGGFKHIRSKHEDNLKGKITRYAALTAISDYVGNLPKDEQIRIANRVKVPHDTFSRISATTLHALYAAPKVGALLASQGTANNIDDMVILVERGIGELLNGYRLFQTFKNRQPTLALTPQSGVINLIHSRKKIANMVLNSKDKLAGYINFKKEKLNPEYETVAQDTATEWSGVA